MSENEEYLGDGLYASFDGWQICLRAPRIGGDHFVYLEPSLFRALVDYEKSLRARAASENSPWAVR